MKNIGIIAIVIVVIAVVAYFLLKGKSATASTTTTTTKTGLGNLDIGSLIGAFSGGGKNNSGVQSGTDVSHAAAGNNQTATQNQLAIADAYGFGIDG